MISNLKGKENNRNRQLGDLNSYTLYYNSLRIFANNTGEWPLCAFVVMYALVLVVRVKRCICSFVHARF